MPTSFGTFNRSFVKALIGRRNLIEACRVLARQAEQLEREGGHLLRLLPVNFVFDAGDCRELADAARAMTDLQTKIIRHLLAREGRAGFLDMFDVPRAMRRFVNWQELENPTYLVGRVDILGCSDGYRFCEFNFDSCVAGAEIFDFSQAYFREIGVDVEGGNAAPAPLAELAALLVRRARELDVARIVILDWSAGGGSPGKGYLSFERMKDYVARAAGAIGVHLADERSFDPSWLTTAAAERTFVHRGFMMIDMDDDGAFLDRLLGAGVHVFGTYETEIRMDKIWFALLHDADIRVTLSAQERALIDRYIPYTRALRPDELTDVIADRHRYIFKERNSFGGGGILIGAETSAAQLWADLGDGKCRGWVVQEMLAPEQAVLPDDDSFTCTPHHLVFGLYIYGDRTSGVLVRASRRSRIVNVTIGNAKLAWAVCVDAAQKERIAVHLARECVS